MTFWWRQQLALVMYSLVSDQIECSCYGLNCSCYGLKCSCYGLNCSCYNINWRCFDINCSCYGINWGVSDHHKASPDLIVIWKHQCALMDHNIFMKKRINSFFLILNHSGGFFRTFYIFVAFWSFCHIWKPYFGFSPSKTLL